MSEVRLIDANRLITELWNAMWKYEDETEKQFLESDELDVGDWFSHRIFVQNMSDIDRDVVQKQPTVDAVPVRHGEWIRTDAFPHRIYCSVCYKTYVPNDRWQIWVDDELPKNYCPNCGAKMDGADGERR